MTQIVSEQKCWIKGPRSNEIQHFKTILLCGERGSAHDPRHTSLTVKHDEDMVKIGREQAY